jgi:hypothetical protein
VDSDGDGDGGVKKSGGHHGGHGQMQNALAQALQSLGLTLPSGTAAASATGSPSTTVGSAQSGTDNDGDSDGSTSAPNKIQTDMHQLMSAIFQAVKSEGAASSTSTATGTTGNADPSMSFASGLSALITQAANGQAPSDVQNAFSQIVANLQSASGVAGASSTSGAATTAATATVTGTGTSASSTENLTLQALLTQLQQNIGYNTANNASTVGSYLSQTA